MRLLAILLLIGAAAVAAVGAGRPAAVCTPRVHAGPRDDAVTLILGTPLGDTVEAGSGGAGVKIFGQVVEVRRMLGPDADALTEPTQGRGPRVVLVPWGYEASCISVPWRSSWLWADPYVDGLFTAHLRPREQWAGELPTYDIPFASYEPFPWAGLPLERHARPDAPGILSAAKLLDVYAALPSRAEIIADPDAALAKVEAWERDNAALVAFEPMPLLLLGIRYVVDLVSKASAARRTNATRMAGTYRVEARAASGEPVVLSMYTTGLPSLHLPGWPSRYSMAAYAYLLPAEDVGLAANAGAPPRAPCSVASLFVEGRTVGMGGGALRHDARLDGTFPISCFPDHAGFAAARDALRSARIEGRPYEVRGGFIQEPGGAWRFEQTVRVGGGVVLELRGTRISERMPEGG